MLTIDVEDWFHILDLPTTPDLRQWDSLPSRVEDNFRSLLDICDQYDVKATCFFLGWVAERYPALVREAALRGHEVASHGYAHRLVYEQSPEEFFDDALRSKKIIEDALGEEISGFRATGFSVTEQTPWFFEKVVQADYKYDASLFPTSRGHGGMPGSRREPHWIDTESGRLFEFPVTVARVANKRFCFSGGGYFRVFPTMAIRYLTNRTLGNGVPAIFYLHPREIDFDQPRLPMNPYRRFKSYVNIDSTPQKLSNILGRYSFVTMATYLSQVIDRSVKTA